MEYKYTMRIQNNKEIPLIVKCSIFTSLRMFFNSIIFHKPNEFKLNNLGLEENNNILSIESSLTFNYKNEMWTSKYAKVYVSPDYTDKVEVYIAYNGTVWPSVSQSDVNKVMIYDDLNKFISEDGAADFYTMNKEPDLNISLLKDANKLEIKYVGFNNEKERYQYVVKYKDEYNPDVYY